MALRNILREPRRELTETLVGAAVVVPLMIGDYYFARWLSAATTHNYGTGAGAYTLTALPLPFGLIIGPMLAMIIFLLAVGIHALGETLCNRLERDGGIRLRPRR